MSKRSLPLAYLLWLAIGTFGGHRFYLRSWGWGVVFLLTGGFFTIGWFVDAFTLPSQVERHNRKARGHGELATAQWVRHRTLWRL